MYLSMYDPMVLESSLPYPKTLDESVLVARAGGPQEVHLLENGVGESVTDADSRYVDAPATGDVEGTPLSSSQFSERDGSSDLEEGAEAEPAQEQEPSSLAKPHRKDNVIDEQQYEEHRVSPPKFSGGGTVGRAANGRVEGEKKRKRCPVKSPAAGTSGRAKRGPTRWAKGGTVRAKSRKDWTDKETQDLLQAVPKKTFGRLSGNESSWEAIAEAVPGRTGDQCRMRMDTLMKAYKAINKCCEEQKTEVLQMADEVFKAMIRSVPKLSTRFQMSWYDLVRDYCPPRSYKKMMNQGAGSLSENEMNADSFAATLVSTEAVTATADQGKRSKLAMERSMVVPKSATVVSSADPGGQSISSSPALVAVMAQTGPYSDIIGAVVGTPDAAWPARDPPGRASPALPQGLQPHGDPLYHPHRDANPAHSSIGTASAMPEPPQVSPVHLRNVRAAAVDDLCKGTLIDVDYFPGIESDGRDRPLQYLSHPGVRDTKHGSDALVTDGFEDPLARVGGLLDYESVWTLMQKAWTAFEY